MKRLFILITIIFLSCNNEKKAIPQSKPQNVVDSVSLTVAKISHQYQRFMPDTSLNFSNWDSLSAYTKPLQKDFFLIKLTNGEFLHKDISDTSLYIKNQFTVLLDYLFIKHISILPKSNQSMSLLEYGIAVPGATSSHKRLEIYNSFPFSIQNNEIGKRVFKRINGSIYEKNIGFNMLDFANMEVYDFSNNKKLWKDLFTKSKKYKIIVFGASWCSPCLIQERKLKKYYTSIDSSETEIIGISIDKDLKKLANYLQRENFPWNTYRVVGETENPIMKNLGFTGIPRNFLVDSKGRVLKEDLDILEILRFLKIELTEM